MTGHQARPPFFATGGSDSPRIVFVGEAWGESEDLTKKPFVGESGKELFRMLGEAMPEVEPELHRAICDQHKYGDAWVRLREEWFQAAGLAFTNVLAFRPLANNLDNISTTKKEATGDAGTYAPIKPGKYIREEFLPELDRLRHELASWKPNLVVALGNTAIWALLQGTNIGSVRGSITQTDGCGTRRGFKVLDGKTLEDQLHAQDQTSIKLLPTYHPSGVLRNWAWRTIVVADLMKAHREGQFPEVRRPKRRVLVDPTIEEVEAWEAETYRMRPQALSPDVETEKQQITKIGFARTPWDAIVIPFWDRRKSEYSYWPTIELELRAWAVVERLLRFDCPKIGQNFIYDLQYITKVGIQPTRVEEDTMLLHHSMYPELQKGLGFLGSIYTQESSWKLLRKRKADTEKKDE